MAEKPVFYKKMQEEYPKFMDAIEVLGKTVKEMGYVDEKYAQLIQLAAAAAIRSEGAVHSHVKRAFDAGATKDEIYQTIMLLVSTIGFPAIIAALSWVNDIVEQK